MCGARVNNSSADYVENRGKTNGSTVKKCKKMLMAVTACNQNDGELRIMLEENSEKVGVGLVQIKRKVERRTCQRENKNVKENIFHYYLHKLLKLY